MSPPARASLRRLLLGCRGNTVRRRARRRVGGERSDAAIRRGNVRGDVPRRGIGDGDNAPLRFSRRPQFLPLCTFHPPRELSSVRPSARASRHCAPARHKETIYVIFRRNRHFKCLFGAFNGDFRHFVRYDVKFSAARRDLTGALALYLSAPVKTARELDKPRFAAAAHNDKFLLESHIPPRVMICAAKRFYECLALPN